MPVVIPPAGLSPAGFFAAQTYADPGLPAGILADPIDPKTGEYLSIRKGMDPIDAQVIRALSVVRNSGVAVTDDGHTFRDIQKVDDTTATLIESTTRTALQRLVDNRDITILSLKPVVDVNNDFAYLELVYRNLRAKGPGRRVLNILP